MVNADKIYHTWILWVLFSRSMVQIPSSVMRVASYQFIRCLGALPGRKNHYPVHHCCDFLRTCGCPYKVGPYQL